MLKIAHIINPVHVSQESDLFLAQPVTFESMRMARDFASGVAEVSLIATMYPEDHNIEPEGFIIANDLTKEIGDIKSFREYRKLPLIVEIFDRLTCLDADYYIYTNVDIALKPYFYNTIAKYIDSGLDAFVINRKTISDNFSSPADVPLMMAEVGLAHPGYDCFVFHKSLIKNFTFGNACIGANWIGRVIITNLLAQSENFKVFDNQDLTFHIGDDRSWKTRRYDDYNLHNETELLKIINLFISNESCQNHHWITSFKRFHQAALSERQSGKEIFYEEKHLSPIFDSGQEKNCLPVINDEPIFIVGHPRSGTTLVQTMLGTQRKFLPTFETHYFDIVLAYFNYSDGLLSEYRAQELILLIRKYSPISKRTISYIEEYTSEGINIKILFDMIIEDNLHYIHKIDNIKDFRWIEKTPDHVFYLKNIIALYPKAHIINVIRNPEKVILSRRQNFLWNNEQDWSIEKHAMLWNDSINSAIAFHRNYPEVIMTMRLEDIAEKQHKAMKVMCKFVGTPYRRMALKKRRDIADKIIHPWESWKMGAKSNVSMDLANRSKISLSGLDRLLLSHHTLKQCDLYDYHINLNSNDAENNPGNEVFVLLQEKNKLVEAQKKLYLKIQEEQNENKRVLQILDKKKHLLEQKDEDIIQLRKIIEEKNYWINIFETRIENTTFHVDKLKFIVQEKTEDIAALTLKIDKEYKKFDTEFLYQKEELFELKNKNQLLEKENKSINDKNKSMLKNIESYKLEVEKLKQRLTSLESKYRTQFFTSRNTNN